MESRHNLGNAVRRGRWVAIVSVAISLGVASGASAATTSSSSDGFAAATNYGFNCSPTYNWLHQNWPNISIRSSDYRNVYTRSTLYKDVYTPATLGKRKRHHRKRKRIPGHWDWTPIATSVWYVGASNVSGNGRLGYTVGGLPYYWAIPGTPSRVPANDGYAFINTTDGSYKTLEQYQTEGRQWSSWSRSMWDSVSEYCSI